MLKSRKYKLIPFHLLADAKEGDVESINQVIEHFRPYMRKRSQKKIFDEYGNSRSQIDSEIEKLSEQLTCEV